ncbi:nuclear transport factor 2 family protein [Streptomyces sp. NPDC051913]|uniref:nuclear transport factor 2 family protein n=1 Tax=Streptomyces sp. NPDC051913 TaxID=3365676 RepID=UPI0037D11F6A
MSDPRDVLARYYQAMRDKSADDLADLYAEDAVHEFPFASPGFPPRFQGREAVRAGYRGAWGRSPVRVERIEVAAVHDTGDPEVVVAEHTVVASLPGRTGTVDVPGLLVLRVRDGRLVQVRDYMDGLGVRNAVGR